MNEQSDLPPFFLAEGGGVRTLMRTYNWSTSALGTPTLWSQPLQTIVQLMLDSKTPQFVAWGPELALLYNDAYLHILGDKHPGALGNSLKEIATDIWPDIEPLAKRTLAGEPLRFENAQFTLRRNGKDETAWFDFSCSPIREADGTVGGCHCALVETTDRVLLEQQRQRETERLYSLFEQTPSFVAVTSGPNHVYELANEAYLRFVGQRALIGNSVRDILPELNGQGYLEILDKVYQTGERLVGRKLTVNLQRQPGAPLDEIFIDFVFQPMRDVRGAINGIFIAGYDVTDHQRTEERLRQSEQQAMEAARLAGMEHSRLQALLDAAPVGISFADTRGKILLSNTENYRLWGAFPMSDNVGEYAEWKGWWADHSERHGRRVQPCEWGLARALRGEEVLNDIIEIEPFGMSGQRRTILLRASPVRNADGNIVNAVVAQMDITARMHSETALHESEAKLCTITDAMPQMVWSTRVDGYLDYYNQRWLDFLGVPAGSADSDAWSSRLHPDDQKLTQASWLQSLETGKPYESEYRLRHCSGNYRWCLGARSLSAMKTAELFGGWARAPISMNRNWPRRH